MSVIFEREFPQIVSSSPGSLTNDVRVSADKSRVDISLTKPMTFSKGSVYTTVEVASASIWNSSPNISVLRANNTLNYLISGVAQPTITIPDGLYSDKTLNSEIVRQIINDGNPSNTLTITGNTSTGRIILTLNANVQVDFTTSNIRTILGFNSAIVPAVPSGIVGLSISGDETASFAQTLDWIIKSNIFGKSIALNNSGSNIIGRIPITSSVGTISNYNPTNPTKLESTAIKGNEVNNFYVEICDDSGNTLPQTDPWNIVLNFRETILLSNMQLNMMP